MKKILLATVALLALSVPGKADLIKFYQGTTGYTGPFNAAGTVYGLTQNLGTSCPTLGTCSGDNIAAALIFAPNVNSTIGLTASSTSSVWGDFAPSFGGLGAGSTGDDQIEGSEILHIHFAQAVTLTGVGTLFDGGHTTFGANFPLGSSVLGTNTFLLSTNGVNYSSIQFGTANNSDGGALNLALLSNDFYFKQNGASQPEFYVSALSYSVGTIGQQCVDGTCTTAVPGPIAGAGLPGLILACGGLLGWMRRRKAATA